MNKTLYLNDEDMQKLKKASIRDRRSVNSFIVKGAIDYAEKINSKIDKSEAQ